MSSSVDGERVWDAIGTIRALSASATPFCRVCMRADEPLEPPRSLADLAAMLQLDNLWKCGEVSGAACAWCEAGARAALRVLGALRAADAAHAAAAARDKALSRRATARINARATATRPRRMSTTEVLHISSGEVPPQPPAPSLPAWRRDMHVAVIDDDDEDEPAAPPSPPAPAPPPPPPPLYLAPLALPVLSSLVPGLPVHVVLSGGLPQLPQLLLLPPRDEAPAPAALPAAFPGPEPHPPRKRKTPTTEIPAEPGEGPLRAAADEGGGAKRPLRNADKVDWEDKIPMDVISFMDATDPQAERFIVPDRRPPFDRSTGSRSQT